MLVAQRTKAQPKPAADGAALDPVAGVQPTETPPPSTPATDPAPTVPEPLGAVTEASPAADPAAASSWVFPFARPRDPVEGDNQIVSVTTQDGSTDFHTALDLRWVTNGAPVQERNEAYAFASCTNCQTGAVAFQVILIVGDARIVTPVNNAVAANYKCDHCATHAVAVQLVATLTRQPDPATMQELDRLWAELNQKSDTFDTLPVDDVYATLLAARAQILQLLAAADGSTTATDGTVAAAPSQTGQDTGDASTSTAEPSMPTTDPGTETTTTETTTTETTSTDATATTPPPTDPPAPSP
jgi:putative peptide zinc metalloprotease protein